VETAANKRKLINDPVYGFIGIPTDFLFDLISHPWFQRLRNIKQLGLTSLVYPGAVHTRFHHALGSMHLAREALDVLISKGAEVSDKEAEGLLIAALLHDLGHGPFSHTLEGVLIEGIPHEKLTLAILHKLNEQYEGKLQTAISIFKNEHKKEFFHQMVSGQLDMDRMDYLNRDSFFTGVTEGHISSERLLRMLRVVGGRLVLEEKSVYSIENFLVARRLMYWQVYYHKTVIAAENMLVKIISRARELALQDACLSCSETLQVFLSSQVSHPLTGDIDPKLFMAFTGLDDHDVWCAIKCWARHSDRVLSMLSASLINRHLFEVEIRPVEIPFEEIEAKRYKVMEALNFTYLEASYLVFSGKISNRAYNEQDERIKIVRRSGEVCDFDDISDYFHSGAGNTIVEKYFICARRPSTLKNNEWN